MTTSSRSSTPTRRVSSSCPSRQKAGATSPTSSNDFFLAPRVDLAVHGAQSRAAFGKDSARRSKDSFSTRSAPSAASPLSTTSTARALSLESTRPCSWQSSTSASSCMPRPRTSPSTTPGRP
jgi:hypothetical protein